MSWLTGAVVLNTHYTGAWKCDGVTVGRPHARAVTDDVTRVAQAFVCKQIT